MKRQFWILGMLLLLFGTVFAATQSAGESFPEKTTSFSVEPAEVSPMTPAPSAQLHVWLEQPYRVGVDETFDILIHVENVGQATASFLLILNINGTQHYYESHSLASGQKMAPKVSITFNLAGYYEVYARATLDSTGEEIPAWCWIKVHEEEETHDLEVWLEQPYWIKTYEDFNVTAFVHNAGTAGREDFSLHLYVDNVIYYSWDDFVDSGMTFEMNISLSFSTPGYRELNLTVISTHGEAFFAYCFLWVEEPKGPVWQVWLNQDYYLYENDTMDMEVHIENKGDMGDFVNWTLWINGTEAAKETYRWVDAWSEIVSHVSLIADFVDPWWYNGLGYYNVSLEVDYYGEIYFAKCWFFVRALERFEVWIEQDYYFQTDDIADFGMHVRNTGKTGEYVDIILSIDNGTDVVPIANIANYWLYPGDEAILWESEFVNTSSLWYYSGGLYYDVELRVIHGSSYYMAYCYFYVDSTDECHVSIFQDYYYEIGEDVYFGINLENQLALQHHVNATLYAWSPATGYFNIYVNNSIFLYQAPSQLVIDAWWLFTAPGHYNIYLKIYSYDYSFWYYAECWVYISEPEWEIWINQPYYWEVGNLFPFDFHIKKISGASFYDYMNLTFLANGTEFEGFPAETEIIYDSEGNQYYIFGQWYDGFIPIGVIFEEPGYYEIELIVEYYGDVWLAWCYIWIEIVPPKFDIWIDQPFYVDVFETFDFRIGVNAYNWWFWDSTYWDNYLKLIAGQDYLNVTLWANSTLIYENNSLYIGPNDYYDVKFNYTLTEIGYYEIYLRVELKDFLWETWCWIWVEEGHHDFFAWIKQPYYVVADSFFDVFVVLEEHGSLPSHYSYTLLVNNTPRATNDSVFVGPKQELEIPVQLNLNLGYYDLRLEVYSYDEQLEYSAWCYIWSVGYAEESYTLELHGPDQAYVDSFFDVWVKIHNNGTVSNEVELRVFADGNLEYQVKLNILAGWDQEENVGLEFNNPGTIEIKAELTSTTGAVWYSNSHFIEVLDEKPQGSGENEPSASAPGFELFIIMLALSVTIGLRLRK
ncbi:MAG: hypothetical protein ACFFB3_04480 [Candidatus Hodarchaeota archaeon]